MSAFLVRLAGCVHSFLLSALLLLGMPTAMAADTPGAYTFRSYGPDQGLLNQAVTGMAQDADGFLYVATEDGLFRYDGSRFERFGTAQGLASDSIAAMYLEPGGRLWLINATGAMAWSGTGPDKAVPALILPQQRIEAMAASRDGYLLVATTSGIYEGRPGKLALVAGLPTKQPGVVWISPDGQEALASADGTLFQRIGKGAWKARALPPGSANELTHALLKDERGRIWIRGRRVLLRLASFDAPAEDLSAQLPGASVTRDQLLADAQGRVWTPTNMGLVRFDDHGTHLITEHQGLPTQWITSMLFDREHNLWLASEGVHRLQGRLQWTAHTRRQALPSDTVWTVFRTHDGMLWAGTNRGIAHASASGWVTEPGTEERSLYAFAEESDGSLWVAGNNAKQESNALLLRTPGSSTFKPVPLSAIDGPSTVNAMSFGPDGALYLATQNHGLHRIARNPAKAGSFTDTPVALPKGEATEQVNQVIHDAKGRLWVAGSTGLAFFDGSTWRRYGTSDGLRELQVETLAFSPTGELWISYWNIHGLTRFTVNEQGLASATQIDEPRGLVADNIYSMGFDSHGALWLGTAQGAKRWQNGLVEPFGRGEGLPSDDAAANGFMADPNGDVWFGMATGLAHFHANAAQPPLPPPQSRILHVQDGTGTALAAPIPEVAWDRRTLQFRFAVPAYTNEAKVHAQVRLLGFEDAWRSTDIREARYTGLPPGKFRFEVRAAQGLGAWGPVSMREVVILAPWWLTRWAIALYVLAAAVLVLLLMRWRTGRLRRLNTELESLVRARTLDLEKANTALQEASMVDPLTGLKNRRFLGLSMPDELARVSRQYRSRGTALQGENTTLMFYMVDLDNFKQVNDTYGHAAGDQLLQQASAALRQACRDADFVVRWGGEEFLIVARNADRSCADLLANNLRSAIRELSIDLGNGVVIKKTCSIGFAAYPVRETDPEAYTWEEAVKMADQCLYAAKHAGRDAWVGVALGPDAPEPGPGMADHLGPLVDSGRVTLQSSLPAPTRFHWQ
ncbi:MAG: diguanylate cyclase [Massilia sp.]